MYFDVWLIAALLGCVIGLAVGIASRSGGSTDDPPQQQQEDGKRWN